MDKKFNFNDQSTRAKILYAVVIGILTVTAIVIGIVSVASKRDEVPPSDGGQPPVTDGTGDGGNTEGDGDKKPEPITFSAPLSGEVMKGYSGDVPVFSETLGDFRIHTGVDISAEVGDTVKAAASGTVKRVYYDPLFGQTVEISHEGGVVTKYSNLDKNVPVKEGDGVKGGDTVGTVGDTSLSELAEEAHLHFEVTVGGSITDPIEFIEKN